MDLSFKFNRGERLKKKKIIGRLFNKEGRSFAMHPIRIIYLKTELDVGYPTQFTFSVPKRAFSKAVDRNRIKRQIKEACRLNKHIIEETIRSKGDQYAMIFLYTGKQAVPYQEIEQKMIDIFKKLNRSIGQ